MSPPSLPPLDLELVIKNISKLPTPPAVTVELLHAIDREDSSPIALAKSITKHQALVVRILRIANSSFYGMPEQVEDISDAITILGMRTIRTLAIATSVFNGLASVSVPGFLLEIFWRHSIATALCCRALANRVDQREGAAFVSGLLHDVGVLVLNSCFPNHVAAVARYQADNNCFVFEAERAVLGMDHAQIGSLLGERWHFPPAICEAIAYHHNPDHGNDSLADVVHLGDALAHALDLADNPVEMVPCISQRCWNNVGLSWQDNEEIFVEVEQEFGALSQLTLN